MWGKVQSSVVLNFHNICFSTYGIGELLIATQVNLELSTRLIYSRIKKVDFPLMLQQKQQRVRVNFVHGLVIIFFATEKAVKVSVRSSIHGRHVTFSLCNHEGIVMFHEIILQQSDVIIICAFHIYSGSFKS